jgi:hypothetical protein
MQILHITFFSNLPFETILLPQNNRFFAVAMRRAATKWQYRAGKAREGMSE